MPAVIRFNDESLDGTVSDVFPSVENGVIRFTVALAQSSHPLLRPSLRTDVLVVTDRKPRALRVKRGPFADSVDRQVFVIRGDHAVRVPVTLGLAGIDDVEVVSGLSEGDEVIISDMRDYAHLTQVTLK
jgi:HlyD family secretion protein